MLVYSLYSLTSPTRSLFSYSLNDYFSLWWDVFNQLLEQFFFSIFFCCVVFQLIDEIFQFLPLQSLFLSRQRYFLQLPSYLLQWLILDSLTSLFVLYSFLSIKFSPKSRSFSYSLSAQSYYNLFSQILFYSFSLRHYLNISLYLYSIYLVFYSYFFFICIFQYQFQLNWLLTCAKFFFSLQMPSLNIGICYFYIFLYFDISSNSLRFYCLQWFSYLVFRMFYSWIVFRGFISSSIQTSQLSSQLYFPRSSSMLFLRLSISIL